MVNGNSAIEFTRRELNSAGKLLAGSIRDTPAEMQQAVEAFRMAYAWRDSHFVPLKSVRSELQGFLRRAGVTAITGARPKRMTSIRKKLSDSRNPNMKLSQIQDLVGCRAIVENPEHLVSLLNVYSSGSSKHEIKFTDYVERPRSSGYRGHHLIAKYCGAGETIALNGHKVEIQLRTRLQHAWATTVEAVGLIRREDLKGGHGCPDWLRLFVLIGSEMASLEDSCLISGATASRTQRRIEIGRICESLGAIELLRKYNQTFKMTEDFVANSNRPYYLLQYDVEQNSVTIKSFGSLLKGANFEHAKGESDGTITSVLVAVDKVDSLRAAYPNYFMDVTVFADILECAANGNDYVEIEEPSGIDELKWLRDMSGG